MVEWFWWDSSLISTTNWFNSPQNDVLRGTLSNQPTTVPARLSSQLAITQHITLHIWYKIGCHRHCYWLCAVYRQAAGRCKEGMTVEVQYIRRFVYHLTAAAF